MAFVQVCGRVRWLIGALVLAAALLGVSAGAATAAASVSCTTYTSIPVALAPGAGDGYTIDGELCASPGELVNGETVQLLIHGATYTHAYWDFGTIDGVSYSYARDQAAAGYPTFAMDEIGTTETQPRVPSADVTPTSVGYVAHQIVQDLLTGGITGVQFGQVIAVGHSQGSLAAWVEAATYHDVAGVIITGAAHVLSTLAVGALGSDLHSVSDDPAFAGSRLDAGYVTTVPGIRATLFYNTADSDPNVIAEDEATKNAVSGTLTATDPGIEQSTLTEQITAPVLVILGGQDAIFCGPEASGGTYSCASGQELATEEAPWYSAPAQLRACVVPDSGHDLNLALNHDLEELDAAVWSSEYVGQLGAPVLPGGPLPYDCSN